MERVALTSDAEIVSTDVLGLPMAPALGVPRVAAPEAGRPAKIAEGRSLKLELQQFEARGPGEFESAFAAMAVKHVDAVTIIEDAVLIANAKAITSLAVKNRLPLIAFNEAWKLAA